MFARFDLKGVREDVGNAVIDGVWQRIGGEDGESDTPVDFNANAACISQELRRGIGIAVQPDEVHQALWGEPGKFRFSELVTLVHERSGDPKFWI